MSMVYSRTRRRTTMRDLSGLMKLAVARAQRISAICTQVESSLEPGTPDTGAKIAEAGGSTLWHVASAQFDYSSGEFRTRRRAADSLGAARTCLMELTRLVQADADSDLL